MGSSTDLVDRIVLDYLQRSEQPVDTKSIKEMTSLHYQTVVRMMRRLVREKRVKKVPGPGNSYRYIYLTHERQAPKNLKVKDFPVGVPIKAETIRHQFQSWASLGWKEATIVPATKDMRKVIAVFYEWCAKSLIGERELTRKDLDTLNDQLLKIRTIYQNHLDFVDGLLATRELWSLSDVTSYLLDESVSDESDVEKLLRQVNFILAE